VLLLPTIPAAMGSIADPAGGATPVLSGAADEFYP